MLDVHSTAHTRICLSQVECGHALQLRTALRLIFLPAQLRCGCALSCGWWPPGACVATSKRF